MSSSSGWCGRNDKIRMFSIHKPMICYDKPSSAIINQNAYNKHRLECLQGCMTQPIRKDLLCTLIIFIPIPVQEFIIPKKSARTWRMVKGDLCRITVHGGSQVGDLNLWNAENTLEHFYSGKTRQLHASHLTTYDRLWSNLPFLRPMATIVADSLASYGIDEDGASCHDVIGTRCDQYTHELITGKSATISCHSLLTEAVAEIGLAENDVHDVWNVFMCTGFTKDTHQYFCKASPAQHDDYIEFIAEMNLILALATCPQGDVSTPVGQQVPDSKCNSLKVQIFKKT